jgi:hypothetical protein
VRLQPCLPILLLVAHRGCFALKAAWALTGAASCTWCAGELHKPHVIRDVHVCHVTQELSMQVIYLC